jgi:hypothetical protein
MFLLIAEGLSLTSVVKDSVDTVYVAVDDDDVLTVLVHSLLVLMGLYLVFAE